MRSCSYKKVMDDTNAMGTRKLKVGISLMTLWDDFYIPGPHTNFQKLNGRWWVNFSSSAWVCFWKKVWDVLLFHRDKVSFWRIINHGFSIIDGKCPRESTWECALDMTQQKTIEHMFHECRNLRQCWATVAVLLADTSLALIFYKN